MSLNALLEELHHLQIQVQVEDGQLRITAPPGAVKPELLKRLKEYKPKLMDMLQAPVGEPVVQDLPAFMMEPRDARNRLSPAQLNLWRLQRLDPENPVYHLPFCFRFRRDFALPAFSNALDDVIQRHEILRTCFPIQDGEPIQQILADYKLPLMITDIPCESTPNNPEVLPSWVNDFIHKPFNLMETPPIRVVINREGNDGYLIIMVIHHLIFDGASFAVLLRELSTFYQSRIGVNSPVDLPPFIQYADYVKWDEKAMASGVWKRQREYWKSQLKDLRPLSPLPGEKKDGNTLSYGGRRMVFGLDKELIEKLRLLSNEEGVSLFITMFTAWAVLLRIASRQEDFTCCIPVPGRMIPEIKDAIGFYNNLLCARIRIKGNPSLKAVMQEIRGIWLEALEHQHIPIQTIMEFPELKRYPFSRIFFTVESADYGTLPLFRDTLRPEFIFNGYANYHAGLRLQDFSTEIKGYFEYQNHHFDARVVEGMIGDYLVILSEMTLTLETSIEDLNSRLTLHHEMVSISASSLNEATYDSPTCITAAAAQDIIASGNSTDEARDSIENELLKIFSQILGVKEIKVNSNFFAMGGNSLLTLELVKQLKEQYHWSISLSTIIEAPTVQSLAAVLRGQKDLPSQWSSLVSIRPQGNKPPLFFLHMIGGDLYYGRRIATYLTSDQPVYGLQPPGCEGEFRPYHRIEEMATQYIAAMKLVQPSGPYLLAAWSWGGHLALEMACQLEKQGQPPALTAIIDTPLHQRPIYESSANFRELLPYFIGNIPSWFFATCLPNLTALNKDVIGRKLQLLWKRVLHLFTFKSQREFVPPVENLFNIARFPKNMHQVMRIHYQAGIHYKPREYHGRITLFRALSRPLLHSLEPDLGWGKIARGGVKVIATPGTHLSITQEPQVKILADKLQVCLDKLEKIPGRSAPNDVGAPIIRNELEDSDFNSTTTIEQKLGEIWAKVMQRKQPDIHDHFFALGGNSLMALRLVEQINRQFRQNFTLSTILQAPTVKELAGLLRRLEGLPPPWSSLVVIQPGRSRPPLFCMHAVGGNVLGYHLLARHIGESYPVYGLQSVGLDGVRSPYYSLEKMAAHYVRDIREFYPEGPYLLAGHSFGGLVAYEIARQLQEQGCRVALTAVFDTWINSLNGMPFHRQAWECMKSVGNRFGYHSQALVTLPFAEKIDYCRRKARTIKRRLNNRRWQLEVQEMLEAPGEDLPPAYRNVREANYMARNQYDPRPYSGRVTLFRVLNQGAGIFDRRYYGWDRLAQDGVEVIDVPGDHLSLLSEPNVSVLAEHLRECIDQAI